MAFIVNINGLPPELHNQCLKCPHYSEEPRPGCWLGIEDRTAFKLEGVLQIHRRKEGRIPDCFRWKLLRNEITRPIRVVLLTPTLLFGGAERWVVSLANNLSNEDVKVVGVGIRDPGSVFPSILDSLVDKSVFVEGESSFEAIVKKCDVVIAWGLPNLRMLKSFVSNGGRVVVVSHGHCDWTVACIKQSIPYSTDWASVSRHARLSFPDSEKVTVVHNGIDVSRCKKVKSRKEVRKDWGAKDEEILIGYIGRMSVEKNPLAAVVAAKTLGPPYRAVLVGGGPSRDWYFKEAQKMTPNVILRPPVEQVGDVYGALDCFVLASQFEGFSLSLAEAWYCECATVSTPVGATELKEEHGQLSIEVPVNPSPDQLAKAVRLATSKNNLQVVSHAAKVVAEKYTDKHMCERWRGFLLAGC